MKLVVRTFALALAGILLSLNPGLYAQETEPAETVIVDSLKSLENLKVEQENLRHDIEYLKAQIQAWQQSNSKDSAQLSYFSSSIDEKEQQLLKLTDKIIAQQPEMDSTMLSSEGAGDDETAASVTDMGMWEDEDDMGDSEGEGDDFNINIPSPLMRAAPTFNLPFPIQTPLGEAFLRYNRVEGLYLGAARSRRLYWHSKPALVGTGSLGYGFANHTWRYSGGLYAPLYPKNMIIQFGFEGHSLTDSKDTWIIDRDENTAMAFFAREDFMDYFTRKGFAASAAWYYRGMEGLNLTASFTYMHDTYDDLLRNAKWSMFGGGKVFAENPFTPQHNLNSFIVVAGASTVGAVSVAQTGWEAQVSFESAGGTAKGDFEFSQIIADVRRYQPLAEWLSFNARVRIGASDGILPPERLFELGGVSTLPGYGFKEFSGKLGGSHFGLINAELIIKGSSIGEMEGWFSGVISMINLILFYDRGSTNSFTSLSDNQYFAALPAEWMYFSEPSSFSKNFVLNNWKSDAGFAIGSPNGGFRIGAAWPLEKSAPAHFILRFSRPF